MAFKGRPEEEEEAPEMESDERMPAEKNGAIGVCTCVRVCSGSSKRVTETSNQSPQQATEGMRGGCHPRLCY